MFANENNQMGDGQIVKNKIIEKLNTKFGVGEFKNFFPISETRLREDDGLFILQTNTLDITSEQIIKSLGFEIVEVNDILDSRKISFKEGNVKICKVCGKEEIIDSMCGYCHTERDECFSEVDNK